jgi:AraC family L-rhamnose operon regulatory protein RhaS
MKSTLPAIFHDKGRAYKADTCDPVRVAVARGDIRNEAVVHGAYPGRRLSSRCAREICCAGFWDATKDQTWGMGEHRNEGVEWAYLARGNLYCTVDGKGFPLRPGHLSITRPWQSHTWGNPNVTACRHYYLILDVGVRRPDQKWRWPKWLLLSPTDLERLTTLMRHNEQPVWKASHDIAQPFEKLGALIENWDKEPQETLLKLHVNELLVAVLQLLDRRKIPLDESLASSLRTVEMFLTQLPQHVGKEWDLESMAAQCGLGRSRFTHYCRQIVNVSPMEYLQRCRIELATRLLSAQPPMKITEVARLSGFQSGQYFATVFHEHTGLSPREFREAR